MLSHTVWLTVNNSLVFVGWILHANQPLHDVPLGLYWANSIDHTFRQKSSEYSSIQFWATCGWWHGTLHCWNNSLLLEVYGGRLYKTMKCSDHRSMFLSGLEDPNYENTLHDYETSLHGACLQLGSMTSRDLRHTQILPLAWINWNRFIRPCYALPFPQSPNYQRHEPMWDAMSGVVVLIWAL